MGYGYREGKKCYTPGNQVSDKRVNQAYGLLPASPSSSRKLLPRTYKKWIWLKRPAKVQRLPPMTRIGNAPALIGACRTPRSLRGDALGHARGFPARSTVGRC